MSDNLYLVYSQKPDWVSRDDYHAWYVDHAQENIESAGFQTAQRYVVREVQNGRAVGGEQHLCVYSYSGDMQDWRADLNRRIQGGDIVLKDWHHDIAFRSWDCQPVGDLLRHHPGLTAMAIIVERDDFASLVSPDAELTLLATGYVFTEGPVWSVREQALYYSDIPDDRRFRWTEGAGAELVAYPTFKGNGMAYDVESRLIVCEHVSSSISRFHDDGFRETVCFHHDGVYLNSPNDLVSRKRDGYIYFTDPDYGRWNDWIGSQRTPLLGYTAVFRVPHEGGPAELVTEPGEFEQPNGLCFSPDETKLYVNDSPRAHIKVFDVADDGTLVNGRVFAEGIGGTIQGGSPDGMECDEFGNVWTTGPGGVWVFDPETGERIGLIETPEVCGSLCWGGADLRTLFLTTSTTVHSMPTLCTSAPLPHY